MNYQRIIHSRIRALIIMTSLVFALIVGQLFSVQVVRAGAISKRAADELLKTSVLLAPRGLITDANGLELARSVAAINIIVDQTEISDPKTAALITAPVLNMPINDLENLYTGKLLYKIVVKNATPAMWIKLQDALSSYNGAALAKQGGLTKRIVGFFSERGYIREYPTGTLTSSLLGFTNGSGIGAAGLESSLDKTLAGVNGEYIYDIGAGTIIPGSARIRVEAKPGSSVKLTIDRDIQWVAQDAITTAVQSAKAKSGTVIVMDPKSGAIIALASAPTFDPADPKTISLASIRNPAVQDIYEPGSTGKVITIAAALEEGKVTPTSVFTIPYTYKVGNATFRDHEHHPTERLTTTGLLAISSNTGAIQVGEKLGSTKLYDYLTKFGIGKNTGSNLLGESPGILHPLKQWSGTSEPTISFGQGYSVTALQATSVFATIANNGVRVIPTVIAGTTDSSGNYAAAKGQLTEQVISAQTAINLRTMLESVVSENGTAPSAAIPGYRVAGKTGTAMRYNDKCHCYSGYTASFIGFAPAEAPKYVVSVTIQDPQGLHWGGSLGGPVFKKVMSFVLQSKQIAQTRSDIKTFPLSEGVLIKAVLIK
ncbi:MAG: penicillin-binding protein 2 [Actinomycetales bacterium]|nr:MAG: penicillin-binding protein 2 [Actinomycetales bacterium]